MVTIIRKELLCEYITIQMQTDYFTFLSLWDKNKADKTQQITAKQTISGPYENKKDSLLQCISHNVTIRKSYIPVQPAVPASYNKGNNNKKGTTMLQDQAYNYLIDIIKRGDLETDRIYSINQMAGEIGISRTPFRDAVMRLAQERYIDVMPSKGFRLHKMEASDIDETYQIRSALESYCMKQLASHISTERGYEYYHKLEGKVKSQREIIASSKDPEAFGRKDYEFHRSIVQYVGNESMLEIYRRFMYRIFWLNVSSFTRKGRMEETVEEHSDLLRLIWEGKVEQLDPVLNHHLETPRKINLELIGAL